MKGVVISKLSAVFRTTEKCRRRCLASFSVVIADLYEASLELVGGHGKIPHIRLAGPISRMTCRNQAPLDRQRRGRGLNSRLRGVFARHGWPDFLRRGRARHVGRDEQHQKAQADGSKSHTV